MRNRGPSPVVPSLMVAALGLLICGPLLLSLLESLVLLLQGGISFVMVFLLLLLLLLIQWLTVFPGRPRPRYIYSSSALQQTSSSGYDDGGFGLGTLIMVVLFFILYSLV